MTVMAKAKVENKYEAVDFTRGGWFVHGGSIGETYFKNKADAVLVADALNMMERLKLKSTMRKIEILENEMRVLREALTQGTADFY